MNPVNSDTKPKLIYSVEMFFTTEFTHMYNYTMNIVPSNEKTQLLLINEANI